MKAKASPSRSAERGAMPHTRPPAATPDAFASLAHAVGNRTLRRTVIGDRGGDSPKVANRSDLILGRPGDGYEQEADQLAERVMRKPTATLASRELAMAARGGALQRQCVGCAAAEENELHRSAVDSSPEPAVAPLSSMQC